jgi:hypothetical protein
MIAKMFDIVADAPNAEFPEVGQILTDLRRIQMEPFGKFSRGDRLNTSPR